VLVFAILITAGCSMDYPILGIEVLRDGAMESKLRVRYFESKSAAIKFYEENKIEKYSLHINPDEDEKKLFDGIE
jgi:hypothetical protein